MRHLPVLKETPYIKNCTTFYLRNLLKKYVSSGFEYVGMEHWYFQCPYRYALNERKRPRVTRFFFYITEISNKLVLKFDTKLVYPYKVLKAFAQQRLRCQHL